MDFLNKAKNAVLQAAGITDNVPDDPQLDALKEKISQLDNIIGVLRKNFHKYSSTVTQLTQTAALVGNDVQQFYIRSKTRQASIQKFQEVQTKLDSVATDVFRDQFHKDILVTFDKWQRQVQGLWGNMKLAEELHVSLAKQDQKLKSLKDPKSASKSGSKELLNVPELENEFAFTKARLDTLKAKLETEVNQAVENRYTVFDNILVRLMECQIDFFAGGSTALDQLKPNVDNYRKRFPRGSLPDSLLNENGDAAVLDETKLSDEKPKSAPASIRVETSAPKHGHGHRHIKPTQRKESAMSDQTEEEEEEDEEEEEEEEPSPSPAPVVNKKPPVSGNKAVPSIDLIGDYTTPSNPPANSSSVKNTPATKPVDKAAEFDLFGGFDTGPAKSTPTTTKPAASASAGGDLLSSLMGEPSSESAKTKPKDLKTKISKNNSAANSSSVKSNPNPKGVNKPTGTPAQKPISKVTSNPNVKTVNKGTSEYDREVPEDFTDTGPINDDEKKPVVKIIIDKDKEDEIKKKAQEALEEHRERMEKEEELNKAKREHRLALEEKLNNWEFKSGIRKNIRTLLTTVHTVMWEGSGLDPVPLSTVMNDDGLKKAHRKVVMKCHPDRVKGNPEQEVIAERVFNALNTQYEAYKNGATQ